MMIFSVDVIVFGLTAVGKTSLLAAMFNSLQTNPVFDIFVTKSDKSLELDGTLCALKKYIRTLSEGHAEGIPPTPTKKVITFNIVLPELPHSLNINFIDMPGEWLGDPQKRSEWIERLRSSDIIINVISAPAMMEKNREYNGDINKPHLFKEYLGEALSLASDLGTKNIFLVPVKCEKYMDNKLLDTLREVYKPHRTNIRNYGHRCYGLPVHTLGSVVFDKFDLINGMPLDSYKIASTNQISWIPKNHDVLVAHILNHCILRLKKSFPSYFNMPTESEEAIKRLCTAVRFEDTEQPIYKDFKVEGGGCFSADTLIRMADNKQVPISMIDVGMQVMSFRRDGMFESRSVLKIIRHDCVKLFKIHLEDCDITVTHQHPLLVNGKWKRVDHIIFNDQICAYDTISNKLCTKTVLGVSKELIAAAAYNIFVAKNYSYLANDIVASSFIPLNGLRHSASNILNFVTRTKAREIVHA